ncbi:nucleosidase [Nocardioides jiangxiensis]|uniref:Nucleosidase n=1 Tax=Nocardioides jiangxiensis TaxID=3064524 RepID=A0ABT9B460_9ACTN|nr:nucleosidase [Nocardioides sp. WY-20]MDO7869631.1 nucleosidase [Nocardioides sp. WY-20]
MHPVSDTQTLQVLPADAIPVVVSATRAEAAHVPSGVEIVVTGLGKTAAATATARALARRELGRVVLLNIGTAGALRDGVVGLHEPGVVINHDINADAIRALGYDPQERLVLDASRPAVLATGDVFVTDPLVRDRLAQQAHLVDMEGYAVAYAAAQFGVPLRMAKHVSDNADESAHDWPAMVELSARALGAWVSAVLG